MKIVKFAIPGLLILLLASAGCNKKGQNDIRGEWSFKSGAEELYVFLFIGSLEKGTLAEVDYPDGGGGHYTVAGEEIEFEFVATLPGGRSCHFSGSFTTSDRITGTMELVATYPPFAWTFEVEGRRL
jgi:hypothetical protein